MSGLILLEQNRDRIRPVLGLAAAGVFLLIYGETAGDLLSLWMREGNPTYSHGPLLLLVCGVLAYKKSKATPLNLREEPDTLGLLLVLGLSLTWLAAALAQVQIVQYLCLVFLLLALFYTLFGAGALRVYGLPVLLLLFSIPMWEIFNGMLQWLTLVSVEFLLNASGIPAVSAGITLEVPAGMFRVEDSCSGLGQFIVAGAVAVIFADILKLNFRKSLFVVLAALAVSIASNIIRVYIVVTAGQMTQMRHPFVNDHYTLGWLLFATLFFAFLYVLTRRLQQSAPEEAPPAGYSQPGSPAPKNSYLVFAIPCLVGLTGPLLLSILNSVAETGNHAAVALPAEIGDWKNDNDHPGLWQTRFDGYDFRGDAFYSNNERVVQLTVYQYIHQQQGKEAVSDSNFVYGEHAEPLGWGMVTPDAGHHRVREGLFRLGSRRQLVWYWYRIAGRVTANPLYAKLLGVWGRLTGEPGVSVFIVATDASGSVNAARVQLADFTDALPPSMR